MEYLLKASIVIAIFYGCYKLFLQRDTFFESNRLFLLLGLITAFALPFVVIPVYIEYTPMPIQNLVINSTTPAPVEITETPIDIWQYVFMVYAIGVGLFFIRFCVQLGALALLILKTKNIRKMVTHLLRPPTAPRLFLFLDGWFITPSSLAKPNCSTSSSTKKYM